MQANAVSLLDFLEESVQLEIPIFQRKYMWGTEQCQELWQDVLRVGEIDGEAGTAVHFLGPVVYLSGAQQGPVRADLVIDGQQRLATMSLLLFAIANVTGGGDGSTASASGKSQEDICRTYLGCVVGRPPQDFKLQLTEGDREALTEIYTVGRGASAQEIDQARIMEHRLWENYRFFVGQVEQLVERGGLPSLWRGIERMKIIRVSLEGDLSEAQLIFESLNSKGLELTQADLIRNYVLMDPDRGQREHLYRRYWQRMELMFGGERYARDFVRFVRHYLTVHLHSIPSHDRVYAEFVEFVCSDRSGNENEKILADLHRFAEYYCEIAYPSEKQDPHIAQALENLLQLRVEVTYPFLLALYRDYRESKVDAAGVARVICTVESFLFRRAVCGYPSNSHNKMFDEFADELDRFSPESYVASAEEMFVRQRGTRQFPSDEEFRKHFQERNMYNSAYCPYWLHRMENHAREGGSIDPSSVSVEHVMPQTLSDSWRQSLGEAADAIHGELLHTVGNLTLTGYNEKYSNRSFHEKKTMEEGFNTSQLQMNRYMRECDDWNNHSIQERASQLAETALKIWPRPKVKHVEGVVGEEQGAKVEAREPVYRANLSVPRVNELYQSLRDRILQSNEAMTVRETIYYIGFRVDRTVVSVVPKQDRIEVALNIPYQELDDPGGMCRDGGVTYQWRYWSVLDYADTSQLDDVMGLVDQVVSRSARPTKQVSVSSDRQDAEFDNDRAVALDAVEQVEGISEDSSEPVKASTQGCYGRLKGALLRDIRNLDAGAFEQERKYYTRIYFCDSELYVWQRKDHLMLVLMIGEQVLFDPEGRWLRIETKSGFRTVERRFRFDDVSQLPYIMGTLREVIGM